MIDVLSHMDERIAVGILARAALSLDGLGNPAADLILADEAAIREEVISSARLSIGLSPLDNSADAIERIGDFLDQQADRLIGPSDVDAALRRLAESGTLPTDMYEIQFAMNLEIVLPNTYELERELIEATIRQPDKEQHYARSSDLKAPSLVSLFYRAFKTKFPFKDFNILVVASRSGLVLNVAQAWRIYPSILDTRAANSLVDVLRIFADEYGARVQHDGKTGSFFLTVEKKLINPLLFQIRASSKNQEINVAQIAQHQNGYTTAALVLFIDLLRYRAMCSRMKVGRDDIVENLAFKTVRDRVAF